MVHGGPRLFRHPRIIAVVMLLILAAVTGGALYVRPLSGNIEVAAADDAKR